MPELIQINVTLLGDLADLVLDPRLEYALVPPARLGTLLELIAVKRPELWQTLPGCRCTVNGQTAKQDTVLSNGDIVEIDSRK